LFNKVDVLRGLYLLPSNVTPDPITLTVQGTETTLEAELKLDQKV